MVITIKVEITSPGWKLSTGLGNILAGTLYLYPSGTLQEDYAVLAVPAQEQSRDYALFGEHQPLYPGWYALVKAEDITKVHTGSLILRGESGPTEGWYRAYHFLNAQQEERCCTISIEQAFRQIEEYLEKAYGPTRAPGEQRHSHKKP